MFETLAREKVVRGSRRFATKEECGKAQRVRACRELTFQQAVWGLLHIPAAARAIFQSHY
jgi:hypothetical protein